MYRMPHKCPICEGKLTVTQLSCPTCGSRLEGEFSGCRFCELSQEESRFLLTFIKNRGSIKDVEREMGVSYPTVRAALDGLIASLGLSTPDAPEQDNPRRTGCATGKRRNARQGAGKAGYSESACPAPHHRRRGGIPPARTVRSPKPKRQPCCHMKGRYSP